MPRILAGLRWRMYFALSPVVYHRVYRWSWAPADRPTPEGALPDGFELVEATAADLPLLGRLGAGFDRAAGFLAAGHRLWLVRRGDTVAFSAWTFIGEAPTDASPTGWIPLPDGVVCQEDTNVHPDFRGRGLAGVASQLIAARLFRSGVADRFVTAILDMNTASRQVGAKSAAREFAVVRVDKIGLVRWRGGWRERLADRRAVLRRVRVEPARAGSGAAASDDELVGWLRSAVREGAPGPARAAGTIERPALAAS
jgi:hypothetical protein